MGQAKEKDEVRWPFKSPPCTLLKYVNELGRSEIDPPSAWVDGQALQQI